VPASTAADKKPAAEATKEAPPAAGPIVTAEYKTADYAASASINLAQQQANLSFVFQHSGEDWPSTRVHVMSVLHYFNRLKRAPDVLLGAVSGPRLKSMPHGIGLYCEIYPLPRPLRGARAPPPHYHRTPCFLLGAASGCSFYCY
jgi:hypothetical protein